MTFPSKDALDAPWADNLDLDISSSRVMYPDPHIDMLQCLKIVVHQHLLRDRNCTRDTIRPNELTTKILAVLVHRAPLYVYGFSLKPCLWFDEGPRLSRRDIFMSI